jgi:methyltransferase
VTTAALLLVIVFIPMLGEARVARRNERALRAEGATEPSDDVFAIMRIAYPLCFLSMIAEGLVRARSMNRVVVMGAAMFLSAKLLKYWAIASLGPRWTFRVLVPPNSSLVTTGPYRFLQHPNYVAVLGEFVGVALLAQAPVAGLIALVAFGLVLVGRVRSENRALGLGNRTQSPKTPVL